MQASHWCKVEQLSNDAGGAPFRTEHARQRRLEKRNAQRLKLRQRFAEVAAKQTAKKQLARVSCIVCGAVDITGL